MQDCIRFMHAADFHLGSEISFLQGKQKAERKAEMIISAERIFDAARRAEVDIVLLSGDMLDSNTVPEDVVSAFWGFVSALGDIPVVLAAGNHDPLTSDSPYLKHSLPNNLYILGGEDSCINFDSLPLRVYGKSFKGVYMAGSARFSLLPPQDEKINLMVLHGDTGYDLSGNYNTITKDFLANSGMDYAALGHIHAFSGLQKAGNTYYAYPGCPEPHGFDEIGEKGIIFGEIKKGSCEIKFLPTALRRHEVAEIDISAANCSSLAAEIVLSELRSRFGDSFDKNLYKIILRGSIDEEITLNTAEILKRISETVFFAKIKDCTELEIDLAAAAKEPSLKGMFVRRMLDKINTEGDADGLLHRAMLLGLKAFSSEVEFDEA